jgi:hypothetical protein
MTGAMSFVTRSVVTPTPLNFLFDEVFDCVGSVGISAKQINWHGAYTCSNLP